MRVGVLGGGQLGQMLTVAGYPLGIKTSCFDSTIDVPAGLVGTVIPGDIADSAKVRRWASHVDVITYEFENFPAELVADLAEIKPVCPGPGALAAAQDRWHEKRLFNELDIPVTPFRAIDSERDLAQALDELGSPVLVKTRVGGYDGKGQLKVQQGDDLSAFRQLLAENELIAEQIVPFSAEVSAIGVRDASGDFACYPIVENSHRKGILHATVAPAGLGPQLRAEGEGYVRTLVDHLNYVGVLTLEMFVVNNRLLANEFAPRVHNSGHWTIEGADTSQFENHLRAITGLPLGSTALRSPTAMVNIVGALPDLGPILSMPGAHLHLYGKTARVGRKLGHVTVTARDDAEMKLRLKQIQKLLANQLPA